MPTTITVKKSAVAGKVPDTLQPAELAVNLADQKLFTADTDGNVFELGGSGSGVTPGPNPPEDKVPGDIWFDENTNTLKYWNGSTWVELEASTGQPGVDQIIAGENITIDPVAGTGTVTVNSEGVTLEELNNILEGLNPDGTPNPDAKKYIETGDNVSELVNDAGYLTSTTLPELIDDGSLELPFVPLGSWAEIPALPTVRKRPLLDKING